MKSIRKRLAGWWPCQAVRILCGPTYMPTPEESERYWDAKMLSETGIDACTLYGPEDLWWWQQLLELREQAAVRKRYDRYLTRLIVACVVCTAGCLAVALTSIAELK